MARSVYPYAPTGQLAGGAAQDYLEPFALLGWLAHATTRIRLGTSVLVVPYRNPLVTAKMLATLDRLSQGRMILGAGVGWLREEFEALAAPPFEARGAVTDEYLRLMRLTWTSDPVRFEGTYYRLSAVHALPKPAQKAGIPIWIGGHTDAALKRAGTLGDGWHHNHHYCPYSARHGFRWWEIDMTYYLVRLLALFGLVWEIRRPTPDVIDDLDISMTRRVLSANGRENLGALSRFQRCPAAAGTKEKNQTHRHQSDEPQNQHFAGAFELT